jgi:hypothetical protein
VLGFVVTAVFRIETAGRALDQIGGDELAEIAPRVTPP